MRAYKVNPQNTELADLLAQAKTQGEIGLEQDGTLVAKIIPFRRSNAVKPVKAKLRPYGQNFSGLKGTDLSWLDEPLDEETQRAFGMID